MRRQHRTGSQHLLLGTASAALVALALAGCTSAPQAANEPVENEPITTSTDGPVAEPVEATDADVVPSEATESTAPTESTPESTAPESNVTVAIVGVSGTAIDTIEVRSFVTDFVGEGTCTIVATAQDGTEYTETTAALPDAKSTTCPTTTVTGLPTGTYSVIVKFESGDRVGQSAPQSIEVGA